MIKRYKQKIFNKGYESGLATKIVADTQIGITEYLKINPKSVVEYATFMVENIEKDNKWKKVTFYVRAQ